MNYKLKFLSLMLLAGCSGNWATNYDAPINSEVSRSWNVNDVNIVVPVNLTTTEANSFAPSADIVWHGDNFGDRKLQVAAILDDGITRGSATLRGRNPVNLNIVLQEFHGVTPAARTRAPSAVHNIAYTIQVVDARTQEPLTEPELIRADLEAHVGQAAFEALAQGETQKVRITRHLAAVTAGWLGIGPDPRRSFTSAGR